ncbi:hypothetical protein VSX61_19640 [Brenneria populi subsp. brevivirga]|uniref:head-tail joining protein n=1 Tax=Brenneria populi TaxID=1505588 RepID=UPI002E195B4E|nr:hypothetical protein [Brenneria populi subsp. brevivirga]
MPVNWDTNLLEPLQKVFGERVNIRPAGGEAYDITGIFDRAYTQDVEPLEPGEPTVNTTRPVLGVRDASFIAPPKKGDRVYVYSVETLFVVSDVQPDSHGGTRLELNRVGAS